MFFVLDVEYIDFLFKGFVDVGICDFIDEINVWEGFVIISSCVGRVSVYFEGCFIGIFL